MGRTTVEFTAEVKNVFNTEQWATSTTTVPTDALGNPTIPLPAPGAIANDAVFDPSGGYEQRQLQLGFRVTF